MICMPLAIAASSAPGSRWARLTSEFLVDFQFLLFKGFELKKVKLLTGLIYLNMAALHHEPFNFALMANGRKIIFDALKTYGVYE